MLSQVCYSLKQETLGCDLLRLMLILALCKLMQFENHPIPRVLPRKSRLQHHEVNTHYLTHLICYIKQKVYYATICT